MISTKKLIKMARTGQKLASLRHTKSTNPKSPRDDDEAGCGSTSSFIVAGHFVVYTADERRCAIPLFYLKNEFFVELLRMAEEEYGLQSDGSITLPCDAVTMDYLISLIQRNAADDLKRALLISIASTNCSSSSTIQEGQSNLKSVICSF